MSGLNAKRDASYITKARAAVAVNSAYDSAINSVNGGTKFMNFQPLNNASADLLLEKRLGCYTCTQNSNVAAKEAGSSFDPNNLARPNPSAPESGGVNNAGSS